MPTTETPDTSIPKHHQLQCMEVWGGNKAAEQSFETAGLKIWACSRPHAQAEFGGDVYYLSSCASGRITRMLLADVSGHGVQVAGVARKLRDLMRSNVNVIKQTRFVTAMNEQFGQFSEGREFATALVSTYFAPTQMFSLCNAGHPPPLIYRSAERGWSELTSRDEAPAQISDTPLGVTDEATYGQLQTRLHEGDMVLSFSDAVTESESSDGRQLGAAGILQIVSELDADQPQTLIPDLVDRLTTMNQENTTRDDTTILLCQTTGGGTTLKDNLLAPFRLLGGVSDDTDIAE